VFPCPRDLEQEPIARLTRQELIGLLLEYSSCLTFRFTDEWLRRQSPQRLRILLTQAREEYRGRSS
jgi:hypothetical protein